MTPRGRNAPPPAVRFWQNVQIAPSGCWEWKAAVDACGYGKLKIDGRDRRVHRWVYEQAFGAISSRGAEVMHTCDNRKCVRLAHLRLGTHTDNMRDMFAKRRNRNQNGGKPRCIRGHEFTAANTGINRRGHRRCRACFNARQQAQRAKAKRSA